MRRALIASLLLIVLASAPASAASTKDLVAGPEGVLFGAESSGTVVVSLDRWDADERKYVPVLSDSREVERGEEYFLEFREIEEAGYYRVTLELGGESEVYRFRYKVEGLPRIGDTSYSADSGGGSLMLSPLGPSMVDARFLLLEGGRVVDSEELEDRLVSAPTELEAEWSTLLSDGENYESVALLTTEDDRRLLLDRFEGSPGGSISKVSADEDSASIEFEGESQVPLDGNLSLTLYGDDGPIDSFGRGAPPLTTGDSESLSFLWDDVLEPGGYLLEARLTSSGEVLDVRSLAFRSEQDADITDVFGDSNGASVTVEGASEVPLTASVRLTLERGSEVLQEKEVPAPIVLKGNEETVEVTWDGDLEPGDYVIRAVLSTERGAIDRSGNVFTVERPAGTPGPTPTKTSPGPMALAFAALPVALYILRRK